ncbi:hypothetical protein CRENBAI_020829 [Crenichthys baileyi]|uniref:Uncharacterized protein n=1 Tax=Crenichthys baileyi TaxID=28760 RepID=A0AAV9S9V7_9TELE
MESPEGHYPTPPTGTPRRPGYSALPLGPLAETTVRDLSPTRRRRDATLSSTGVNPNTRTADGGQQANPPQPPASPWGHSRVKRVQPLSRRWGSEPTLCVEASPTISSRYLDPPQKLRAPFPPSEGGGPRGMASHLSFGLGPAGPPRGANPGPQGALRRGPTPRPGSRVGPGSAVPGDVTCLDLVVPHEGFLNRSLSDPSPRACLPWGHLSPRQHSL